MSLLSFSQLDLPVAEIIPSAKVLIPPKVCPKPVTKPVNPTPALGMLIVYVLVTQSMGISRMRKMTLPAAYMKSVYQAAALQVIGILSIAVGLVMYL